MTTFNNTFNTSVTTLDISVIKSFVRKLYKIVLKCLKFTFTFN